MPNYNSYKSVIETLRKDQDAERERRETVREVHAFLDEDDGQWEGNIKDKMSQAGRPRYTFDRCNDIVDDIAGEIEQADFAIQVKPAGGDASKETAELYDGLVRNIEVISNATDVYNSAGRSMVRAGMDGWRINQRWGDNNTFDQELYIDPIADFVDRVWFDSNSVLQTREDARHCFVLQELDLETYNERFPEGSGQSVSIDSIGSIDIDSSSQVIVGEILYKVKEQVRIVELSNGATYVDDEKYQRLKDEFAERGITEKRDRTRTIDRIKTRLFDGNDFLKPAQDTVFDLLPIVPTYGNFSVSRKKVKYWGIITKKMDAQRVYNYAESRKVEEGALAPLEKIVATDDQVEGHEDEWSNLNTSSDPALFYSHQEGAPPPYKIGGAQINPGLESVSQSAQVNLQSTAGIERLPGQPVGLKSGVAVELEQNKGDTRNYKYTLSQEKAICHTAKILIHAIPKVYDTTRQTRILNEDQTFDMVTLNEPMFDDESGTTITLNDLSKGAYDVTCDVGPAFKNRQSETVAAFNDIASIDPSVLELAKDIWFKNFTTPGMDQVAERARQELLLAGRIPESQLTDEEREFLANQEPQEDPLVELASRQIENEDDRIQLQGMELLLKERKQDLEEQQAGMKQNMEMMQATANELKTQAETLKLIAEAFGVESVTGPNAMSAIQGQASLVKESQADQL